METIALAYLLSAEGVEVTRLALLREGLEVNYVDASNDSPQQVS